MIDLERGRTGLEHVMKKICKMEGSNNGSFAPTNRNGKQVC
jgi:hypothetical protein